MINYKTRNIPATPRSRRLSKSSTGGSVNFYSSTLANTAIAGGMPYTTDINGNYLVDKMIKLPGIIMGNSTIDDEKIILWDEAVDLKHKHDNWEQINIINQNLSTTSTPTFSGINIPNQANIWRANITGGLVLNNKTISGVNSTSFTPYEKDGVMYTNTIRSNSRGITINCPLNFDYTTIGTDRLFINNSPNYAPLQIYNNQYGAGIRLHGTSVKHDLVIHSANDIRTTFDKNGNWIFGNNISANNAELNNLNVKGSFNCYELVANKVRSTNGLLYVTDSATVKSVTSDRLVVIFNEYNLKTGDFLLMQNFTGNSVIKKLIKLTHQSPIDADQFNYKVVDNNGYLIEPGYADASLIPAINDYFVKIDSADVLRRTGILLSPYNGGYIDFYTGAGDGINQSATTSIGNLDHLGIPGVRGVGLHTDNGFFKGRLVFNTNIITPESTNTIIDLTIDQQVVIKVPYDIDINIGAGVEGQTAKIIAMLSPNKRLSIGCIIDNKLQLLDGLPPHYFALILPNNSSIVKVSIVDLLYSSALKRSDGNMEFSGWVVTNLHNTEIDYTTI